MVAIITGLVTAIASPAVLCSTHRTRSTPSRFTALSTTRARSTVAGITMAGVRAVTDVLFVTDLRSTQAGLTLSSGPPTIPAVYEFQWNLWN